VPWGDDSICSSPPMLAARLRMLANPWPCEAAVVSNPGPLSRISMTIASGIVGIVGQAARDDLDHTARRVLHGVRERFEQQVLQLPHDLA
jgi:hypothetical protein